jgi:quinolinate synthase
MNMAEQDLKTAEKIRKLKDNFGDELVILAHHYQRKEIVDLGDYIGDSFELSRKAAAQKKARNIIFCGVHFMAESAEILSGPDQIVQLPDMKAGCRMADMANIQAVTEAWKELESTAGAESITPVVYMNSDARLKAFCGRNEGIVCTSSNAPAALRWAFNIREKILFFPDQHLGRNTGNDMNIPADEMILFKPGLPLGGNSPEEIKKARLILWDGYCSVHTHFTVEHIKEKRAAYPEAKIIVHPECPQEVVSLSDAKGSTSYIVKYVQNAAPGSTIIIGTELNLIDRLALEYPDKKILTLHDSLCKDMSMINLENLLWTLENTGKVNIVTVPEDIKNDAKKALDRMLTLSA